LLGDELVRKRRRQFFGNEAGIAILEAALLVPLLVVMVFFIVDVGGVVWQTVGLQYSLTDTARWIVPDKRHVMFPGNTRRAITNSIRQYTQDRARSLGVRLDRCNVSVCSFDGSFCECAPLAGCSSTCVVDPTTISVYDYPEGFRISGTVEADVILGFLGFPITRNVFTKIEAE
jgi:hypothetical protein